MSELDNNTYSSILRLCEQGDELTETGNYPEALSLYWKAFDFVPEPKTDWEATTWILAAIGDVNYFSSDFQAAIDNFSSAMH